MQYISSIKSIDNTNINTELPYHCDIFEAPLNDINNNDDL